MAWHALMQLLNRAPSKETVQQVIRVVASATKMLPVQKLFVRGIRLGRTRMVLVALVLPDAFQVGRDFDEIQLTESI